jgi:hypothetical protein
MRFVLVFPLFLLLTACTTTPDHSPAEVHAAVIADLLAETPVPADLLAPELDAAVLAATVASDADLGALLHLEIRAQSTAEPGRWSATSIWTRADATRCYAAIIERDRAGRWRLASFLPMTDQCPQDGGPSVDEDAVPSWDL